MGNRKNTPYSDKDIDEKFEQLIQERFSILNELLNKKERDSISTDTLNTMYIFLKEYKPKSVGRIYKISLIDYIDYFIDEPTKIKDKTNCVFKKREKLIPIVNFMTKFDFVLKNSWFPISLILLFIDLLIITSFSQIYFIPYLSIVFSIANYWRDFNCKKKGKLLTVW